MHRRKISISQKARRAGWMLVAAAATGCGGSFPAAPAQPGDAPASASSAPSSSDDAAFVGGSAPSRPGMTETAEEEDVLAPGDLVAVQTLGVDATPPTQTPIDRAGHLHLALAGDIPAAGHTLSEVEKMAQHALARYDRFSQLALTLVDARGRTVTVNGAVDKPGVVKLVADERVADVLAAVGGPKATVQEDRYVPLGDLDGTRIVRAGKSLPIDPRKALEGDVHHNVRLRRGDVVYVPPALAARIVVLGHVEKPRTFAFRPGMRLTEALADAGGLKKSADSEDVRVLRGGYAHPKVYVADVRALFAGQRPDVLLAPGDVVYVSEHWFAAVGDVLEKIVPAAATAALIATTASR